MKQISDHLYLLIKSMTSQEKRYFKLFASAFVKDTKYVQLFDMLNKLKEYDVKKIKSNIGSKESAKKMNAYKFFLERLIVRSLRLYHEETNIEFVVYNGLQEIEVLLHKGFLEKCLKQIKKYREVCKKGELFPLELRLIAKQRDVLSLMESVDGFEELDTCEKDLREKNEEFYEYKAIIRGLNSLTRLRNFKRNKDLHEQLDRFVNVEVSQQKPKSISAEIILLSAWCLFYFVKTEYKKLEKVLLDIIELYESHPSIRNHDYRGYLAVLNNLSMAYGLLKENNKVFQTLEKLRNTSTKLTNSSSFFSEKEDVYATIQELTLYVKIRDFSRLDKERIEKALRSIGANKLLKATSIAKAYYAICLIYMKQFDNAQQYILECLNVPKGKVGKELYSVFRTLDIIVNFELNNDILLPNVILSAKRYLKNNHNKFLLEQTLLSHLERITISKSDKKRSILYDNLISELQKLKNDPVEKAGFEYFDFLEWAEQKKSRL